MAPRKNNRVVLNRAALDAITLGMADGLLALADAVIAAADVPDAAPYGQGLIEAGGTVAYVAGKKVGGEAKKPRAVKVKGQGVVVIGGFPFPAHFAEFGTVNQPARPFLTPALMATVGDAGPFIEAAMARRLAGAGERAAAGAAIRARVAAKAEAAP
ncbi:MAG TPA: hypothetical protein VLM76_11405 [Patescibacteria group bacterium]|nr:hypothetical protein [Patescibacteria group bacterium]